MGTKTDGKNNIQCHSWKKQSNYFTTIAVLIVIRRSDHAHSMLSRNNQASRWRNLPAVQPTANWPKLVRLLFNRSSEAIRKQTARMFTECLPQSATTLHSTCLALQVNFALNVPSFTADSTEHRLPRDTSSKGKVHPRTGHEDPEGEQRCTSTLSLTSALDGDGWLTPRPGRFTPGKESRYPL